MKFFLFATGALTISLIPCEPANAQYQMYSSPGRFMGGGGNLQNSQLQNQVQTNTMQLQNMQRQQSADRYFNSISTPVTTPAPIRSYSVPGYGTYRPYGN